MSTINVQVQSPEENRNKRVVVITARVHPGETNGSWMMKGFLDFLISDSPDANVSLSLSHGTISLFSCLFTPYAKFCRVISLSLSLSQILRDTFIFKVVPMLNPDGVIVGNYRCSLAGRDLNRNYRSKLKESYPTVWNTKAMVKKLVPTVSLSLFSFPILLSVFLSLCSLLFLLCSGYQKPMKLSSIVIFMVTVVNRTFSSMAVIN